MLERAEHPPFNRTIRPSIRALSAAYHGILALRQGNLATALSWSDRLSEFDNLLYGKRHLAARLRIAGGEKAVAAKQLQELYENAARSRADGLIIQIRVYQTLAADQPETALAFLTEALKLGESEGYIRTFVDEGRLLAPLLHQALTRGITPEYTGRLLNIIEVEENQRRARSGEVATKGKIESESGQLDSKKTAGSDAIFEGTIRAMVATLESKDPYTASHQRRVTALSQAIAVEMGLPKETQEALKLASMVHDLGKISVPLDILNKPGKVTNSEFALIKEHSQTGYDILKNVEFPYPIAEIVYQHHERMDGSGYPRGLKDGEIYLEARIIAVSDVVEAVTAHRPYRPALGLDKALEEIKKGKDNGTLDSDVVAACLRLFTEKSYKFE
jgi:putative nucleotidyltransferase with HDIG domain